MGKVNYGAKAAQTTKRAQVQNAIANGQNTEVPREPELGKAPEQTGESQKNTRSVSPANQNTKQVSFRIPLEYHRALKTYAVQNDTTINELFRDMLKDYLESRNAL